MVVFLRSKKDRFFKVFVIGGKWSVVYYPDTPVNSEDAEVLVRSSARPSDAKLLQSQRSSHRSWADSLALALLSVRASRALQAIRQARRTSNPISLPSGDYGHQCLTVVQGFKSSVSLFTRNIAAFCHPLPPSIGMSADFSESLSERKMRNEEAHHSAPPLGERARSDSHCRLLLRNRTTSSV